MNDDLLCFNGIDARSGDYLLELNPQQLIQIACGEVVEPRTLAELKFRKNSALEAHYGVKEGVDVRDLAQTGWGVIFAHTDPGTPEAQEQDAIYEALQPLLRLRREQATRKKAHYYKEYRVGETGYRNVDTKQNFLARQGAGPGPADPEKVPYYLLIVGDPNTIPFRFQSQLGVQYAVGRLHFDAVEDYAHYAASVVAAETGQVTLARRASFFGVDNPDDRATHASAQHLVGPLAELFARDTDLAGWTSEQKMREQATRAGLADLINGRDAPALLFTASHGMGFRKGDPLQERHSGALLCQDWPGPRNWRGKPIPEDFYFAGDHVSAEANLLGSMAFFFACFGAGTPELDEFAKQTFKDRAPIAERAFVAGLPKALLNRPRGGALAVVGHVERAWGCSFLWAGTGERDTNAPQLTVFESTLRSVMGGMPIGAAMEYFHLRYAELSSDLSVALEERDNGMQVDEYALADMWTANNDARGYAILGDPAVRLPLATQGTGSTSRPDLIAAVDTRAEPVAPGASAKVEPAADVLMDMSKDKEPPGVPPPVPDALQKLATALGDTLRAALADATSLEVSTYVSPNLGGAKLEGGKMTGAELRAYTRVSLDGDTVVCLPEKDGAVDTEVWDVHLAMVKSAQETRAELMKTLVAAAASLAGFGK